MRIPLALTLLVAIASSVTSGAEDLELRDLDVAGWNCLDRAGGTAKTSDGIELNRMKNRSPDDQTAGPVESLDTAAFLKKVGDYDSRLQCRRRGELAAAQKDELDTYENQIVSLTGWLVLAYAGPPETANCGNATFHDRHLEIFENPSDHAPRVGDPTPIICEITPRMEQALYREGIRIQSLAGFFRLLDKTFQPTGHKAQKIRVTGYLMWDDGHNGSADVRSTVQYFSKNGFHHPWRSTAWEIHPVMRIEMIE
jgi:hypothetical protein